MNDGKPPSPDDGTTAPHGGGHQPRGRRRGQPLLRRLRSTEHFTNQARLTPAQRKLILFVAVAIADEDGCVTATCQRLLAAHAHDRDHWTRGHTCTTLRKRVVRYVGRGAERIPGWDWIVDTLRVAIGEADLESVLAEAAGLYCRAIGADQPGPDYAGQIRLPTWADATSVSVEDIRAGLPCLAHPPRRLPPPVAAPMSATDAQRVAETVAVDEGDQRLIIDALIRACRLQDQRLAQYGQDLARLQVALADNARLREENQALREENTALTETNRTLDRKNQQLAGRVFRRQSRLDARAPHEPKRVLHREDSQLILKLVSQTYPLATQRG